MGPARLWFTAGGVANGLTPRGSGGQAGATTHLSNQSPAAFGVSVEDNNAGSGRVAQFRYVHGSPPD